MIKSRVFISVIICMAVTLCALFLHGTYVYKTRGLPALQAKKELVHHLGLTDLAIWTEARYTRHPSQADFFSAFQDSPGAFDHFPAGSIMAPPKITSGGSQ